MVNILSNLPGWNKRSVRFYKLFLSYLLLVFFFLTVVGGVVYAGIISALQKEVEQAQLSAVAQIRDTMDTRLRELQRIALQISANPLLTPYALSQYGYGSYQAVSELNKYLTSNSFIHNILLSYSVSSSGSSNPSSSSNRVFAASGVYGEDELYQKIYRYADWSYSSLAGMIQSMNGPVIRPVETVYTNNGTRESRFATYLYPLPAYSGKPNGVVMFLLDEVNLQLMSGQLVSRPGTALYLVDGQGRIVFQTGQASVDMEKIAGEITTETGSISTRTLDGIAYSVVRQDLAYNGWSFITVVPTSLFLEKVEQSRRLFGAILLILLGLGAVTSFVLANSSYQKLRQLVQLFSDKKQPGSHNVKTTDELVYLSNAIREFSGQDSMTVKLQSKKGLIREHILLSLLKNKPQQTDELLQTLELAEVRFEHPDFVTVLLAIDDYANFQAAHSASVQELLKFRMVKAAEEQAAEIGRATE